MSEVLTTIDGIAQGEREERTRKGLISYVYSLYDKKSGTYGNPFIASNDNTAGRIVNDLVTNSGDSIIALHPDDFDLYFLGCYDVHSGEIFDCKPSFIRNLSIYSAKSTVKTE